MTGYLIAAAAAALLVAVPAQADPLSDAVKADLPALLTLYRDLHAHPELSREEVKTAARLVREIKGLGLR